MTALSGGLAADIQAARHLAIVPNGRPDDGDVSVVTIDEFTRQEEDGAEALVGTDEESLIPVGGDVMFYGDGGAGKTTLCIDLACHLAAGEDWLDIPVARPARVLIVENEGPRPPFRKKLRRKLDSWQGGPVGDRLLVLENPWGRFSFATPDWRQAIADTVKEREVDVLVAGPLTRIGMDEAGTLQEVVAFVGLVAEVREFRDLTPERARELRGFAEERAAQEAANEGVDFAGVKTAYARQWEAERAKRRERRECEKREAATR